MQNTFLDINWLYRYFPLQSAYSDLLLIKKNCFSVNVIIVTPASLPLSGKHLVFCTWAVSAVRSWVPFVRVPSLHVLRFRFRISVECYHRPFMQLLRSYDFLYFLHVVNYINVWISCIPEYFVIAIIIYIFFYIAIDQIHQLGQEFSWWASDYYSLRFLLVGSVLTVLASQVQIVTDIAISWHPRYTGGWDGISSTCVAPSSRSLSSF